MIDFKRRSQIDFKSLTAKQACKLATSSKEFMVRVHDKMHLTDEPYTYIMTRFPNLMADEVEIYLLK